MRFALTEGQLSTPAALDEIDALSDGWALPADYLGFLRQHDGGEGFIGDTYVILWRAGELARFNREYEVEVYAPGIVLFGSTGGGEGYGFDLEASGKPVVQIPFIGMDRQSARPVAPTFESFFAKLAASRAATP